MGYSGNRDRSGSLFIGCGEASGDHYASLLTGALRSAGFGGDIWGVLGPLGRAAGGNALWNSDSLSLMGVSEVIEAIPRLIRLKNDIADEIVRRAPSGVVVIDSPDFNIPLLRRLKKKGYGGRIFYLAPPTVWAWRQGRAGTLRDLCDVCFPLFAFERDFLESRGVGCRWFGHPLVREMQDIRPPGIEKQGGKKIAALLPGSRRSETRSLLPVLLEVAEGISGLGLMPVFSAAQGLESEAASELGRACEGWDIFEGPGAELMSASEIVIGSSGTAAVEALILRKHMIVLYRASWISWLAYRLFVKTPWISIPNILAGEEIFPELLQSDATSSRILREAERYLSGPWEKERTRSLMEKAVRMLGDGDVPGGWADSILELLPA